MIEDVTLLRGYVHSHSQGAFAELVQRRIGLVYAVALRTVGGDVHLAQDVTQKVFLALACQAAALVDRPAIAGWLYRSAHHIAVDTVRRERRRRAREQRSELMPEANPNPDAHADWQTVRPLLDDALNALSERDRDAVALRFFEGRAFAEIGRALRLTEDAARKRVERALDQMAAALARRGVTSSSGALSLVLAEHGAAAAPSGLAASVTGAALATAAAGSGWTWLTLSATAKSGMALATAAAIAAGFALHENREARRSELQLELAIRNEATLRAEVERVQRGLASAEQRAAAAEEDNAKLLSAIEGLRMSSPATVTTAPASGVRRVQPERTAKAEPPAASEPQVHVRLIQLSRTPGTTDAHLWGQAQMILARFRTGERFADLAQQFSTDRKQQKGGDWGWQKRSDFRAAFGDVAFQLNKGEASAPILTPEGCFILYAEDRK